MESSYSASLLLHVELLSGDGYHTVSPRSGIVRLDRVLNRAVAYSAAVRRDNYPGNIARRLPRAQSARAHVDAARASRRVEYVEQRGDS